MSLTKGKIHLYHQCDEDTCLRHKNDDEATLCHRKDDDEDIFVVSVKAVSVMSVTMEVSSPYI